MLYYLFHYLSSKYTFPGSHLWQFISFRAMAALLLSLGVTLIFGKRIIRFLQRQQIGEEIRNLGLAGQLEKRGTPTMGGLIIILGALIPTLLLCRIDNVYVILLISCTLWLAFIGGLDDYIKVFRKNKKGLHGKFKVVGQVGLGIIIGSTLYFNDNVVIREKMTQREISFRQANKEQIRVVSIDSASKSDHNAVVEHKSLKTTIPFTAYNEFNYSRFLGYIHPSLEKFGWLFYILVCVFIITAISNGANITDGIDGLAAGTSAIAIATLTILAYVSGNYVIANYLNIMFIPNLGEVVIFATALLGACVGFLWFNAFPAQVFMGDTGSLTLGGLIATLALIVRKEMLLPLICAVFLIENLSVIIQVSWFKYTKKKTGQGRRVFLMSPLHHHYQKLEYHESKITARFWIMAVAASALTIITLKIR